MRFVECFGIGQVPLSRNAKREGNVVTEPAYLERVVFTKLFGQGWSWEAWEGGDGLVGGVGWLLW